MADFADLLRRGRRIFNMKSKGGKWYNCEECGERRLCFAYDDDKGETWFLCEKCANEFIKDEE